uniref:Uncharacterized protein n=1 Tax=Acrobeloides nanus TaxID=290746 RepID=A0A914DJJ5_9BILA
MEEASSSKFEGEDSVKSSEIRADMLDETDPFFIDTAKWMNSMGQLLKEDPYTGQDGLFEWHNTFYNNEITESLYDSQSDEEHSNHIDSLFLPALESYVKQDLEILNEIYQNIISVLVIGKGC